MDPAAHQRPGAQRATNPALSIPRTSKQLQENLQEYALLRECLYEIFEHVTMAVCTSFRLIVIGLSVLSTGQGNLT